MRPSFTDWVTHVSRVRTSFFGLYCTSVSYTHLDVYKRQLIILILTILSGLYIAAQLYTILNPNTFFVVYLCLLDTSYPTLPSSEIPSNF